MKNRALVIEFLQEIAALETRFQVVAQNAHIQNLEIVPEEAVVAYNAFDFANTQIHYQRKRFTIGNNEFHFEYNSIDATNNETKITISSNYGVAEHVMLTDDLIYQAGEWYIWSPIYVGGENISNLVQLEDPMIAQIFHEILMNE